MGRSFSPERIAAGICGPLLPEGPQIPAAILPGEKLLPIKYHAYQPILLPDQRKSERTHPPLLSPPDPDLHLPYHPDYALGPDKEEVFDTNHLSWKHSMNVSLENLNGISEENQYPRDPHDTVEKERDTKTVK